MLSTENNNRNRVSFGHGNLGKSGISGKWPFFEKKQGKTWESGLGIVWEMSISKNMEVYGFHKINFLNRLWFFNLTLYSLELIRSNRVIAIYFHSCEKRFFTFFIFEEKNVKNGVFYFKIDVFLNYENITYII